jgi:RNase H-fold protein (predicted Holliday junction resolvase)
LSALAAPNAVLAIDPGSAKCGVAIVTASGPTTRHRSVVPTPELISTIRDLVAQYPEIDAIVMGNGTGSKSLARNVREAVPGIGVELVDEVSTSRMARERYCSEHPAKGWQKLLPVGMRVPDVPIDDYVAVILAERRLLRDAS